MSSTTGLGGAAWLPFGDKLAHLGMYGVLGATLAWGRIGSGSRIPHALLLLAALLYGVSDEWHQSFVAGRDPSLADLVADGVGALIGYASTFLFLTRRVARPPLTP